MAGKTQKPKKNAATTIVVFGGTGFLGRHAVAALAGRGMRARVAARHRAAGAAQDNASIERIEADIRDAGSVARAMAGATGVINAVGLYVERGDETFRAVHVDGARRVAEQAAAAGIDRLVHISGIGADIASDSAYVRARAEGETAVRAALPDAAILRPSVLFGPEDDFLNTLMRVARTLPVLALFGDGGTRLQPAFVDDVACAAAVAVSDPAAAGRTYELGGPTIYRYRDLLDLIVRHTGRRRWLLPMPFAAWDGLARVAALLPNPPLTRDQIALMRQDNIASPDLPGFADLGIAPTAIEAVLPRYPAPR